MHQVHSKGRNFPLFLRLHSSSHLSSFDATEQILFHETIAS